MTGQAALVAAIIAFGAASAVAAQDGTFRMHAPGVDSTVVSEVNAHLARAEQRIGATLGAFPDTVSVRVFPSRATFSVALKAAWGIPDTACWMVGAADDHVLYLLSPAVWDAEACEHDGRDAGHVGMLVAHEAVHVLHGQSNPSDDVGLLEDIGWFIEGLATYVSGQLGTEHADRATDAIAQGAAPSRLAEAWSGPYRYGVSGSMVAFIDDVWGRATLRDLLTATSQSELLARLDLTEAGFLHRWRGWVTQR